MKTNAILFTRILLVLTIVLFLGICFDFLALHDIKNDYVSKLVMNRFSPSTSISLPDWTNTSGEWSVVQFTFGVKLLVNGLFLFFLFALRRNLK
jgi:hypothetical protein